MPGAGRFGPVAAIAVLCLSACGPAPTGGSSARGDLLPAADGLRVGSTGLEIGFGRAQTGAVAAAAKLVGRQPEAVTTRDGCGPVRLTEVRWRDGLTMSFRTGEFVGWRMEGSRAAAAAASLGPVGAGPGSAGATFERNGIRGRTGPGGTVEVLEAGTIC